VVKERLNGFFTHRRFRQERRKFSAIFLAYFSTALKSDAREKADLCGDRARINTCTDYFAGAVAFP
jgi:hypothetical protein